jgi:glycerophosphoryl diester phosphodiesterase
MKALVLLVAVGLFGCTAPKDPARITWIAHALGGMKGERYTNSLEAFAHSYTQGFRVFEVDLMLTADGDICAFHSRKPMVRQFGDARPLSEVDSASFRRLRYYGKYTPICIKELGELIDKHPDSLFVLDPKDGSIYARLFTIWREHSERWGRVIPQIYSPDDFAILQASRQRFHAVIYTLYRTQATDDEVISFVSMHPEITAVTTHWKRFRPELAARLSQLGRDTFVHTVNDKAEIDRFISLGATGFYTDFYEPSQSSSSLPTM